VKADWHHGKGATTAALLSSRSRHVTVPGPALRQGPHRSPGALRVEMADETMLTRRTFVRLTGASTLSLFFTDRLGVTRQLFA
jgi:hypothetical protein